MKKLILSSLFFLAALSPLSTHAALTDSLISYWSLNESSTGAGAVTREDAHSTNDLTDNNTTASAVGKISNGADFELSNSEYLSIADGSQSGLDISTTISNTAWIKPETISNGATYTYASKYTGTGSQRQYAFNVVGTATGGKIQGVFSDDGTTNAGHLVICTTDNDVVSTGTFYFVAVTFNVATEACVIYVNASSVAKTNSGSMGASLLNGTGPFTLGAIGNPTDYFDGVVDEVGIWDKILTSDEVTELYNAGAGLAYPFAAAAAANQILGLVRSFWIN